MCDKALVALFLFAFAIGLGFCAYRTGLGQTLGQGYREYIIAGQRLVEQGTLVSPLILGDTNTRPSAMMPPAYAALVAGVHALWGAETFPGALTLQLINSLSIALAAVGVFLIARRLAGEPAAWIASIITTANPAIFGYTHLVWDTCVFTLVVVCTVWLCVHLSSPSSRPAHWFYFGLWLGAVALFNAALTITYPFLVLWPITKNHGWRVRPILLRSGLAVAGWLIVITPWTLRNYHHFSELIYIRSGLPLELWLGVCPEADEDGSAVYSNQFPLVNDEIQREVAALGERAFIESRGKWAAEAISNDPWRFARLVGMRAVDYWLGTVYGHTPPGSGGWPRSLTRAVVTFYLTAELAMIIIALLICRKITLDMAWMFAIVVSFSAVYCITHVQIRFRGPVEPIMAILVAMLAVNAYHTLTGSAKKPNTF